MLVCARQTARANKALSGRGWLISYHHAFKKFVWRGRMPDGVMQRIGLIERNKAQQSKEWSCGMRAGINSFLMKLARVLSRARSIPLLSGEVVIMQRRNSALMYSIWRHPSLIARRSRGDQGCRNADETD
jgi:hypothetical protein